MYEKYSGDKNLIRVEGDHNSDRPFFMMDSVAIFFHNVLQCDQLPKDLDDEDNLMNQYDQEDYLEFRLDKVFERQHLEIEKEKVFNEISQNLS